MAYKIGQVVEVNNNNCIDENENIIEGAPDVMDTIRNQYSIPYLNNFGIQARPGSFFAIDGEVIMIGRSGTYEINNDLIQVSSLQLLSKGTFIIDFKY